MTEAAAEPRFVGRDELRCDVHPDRLAVRRLGSHLPQGDGTSGFKTSRRLCAECYELWRRKNIAFEYID